MPLYVRAASQDLRLIESLCAPASRAFQVESRAPMHAVITDATVAARSDRLRRAAEAASLPFLIDPMHASAQR